MSYRKIVAKKLDYKTISHIEAAEKPKVNYRQRNINLK